MDIHNNDHQYSFNNLDAFSKLPTKLDPKKRPALPSKSQNSSSSGTKLTQTNDLVFEDCSSVLPQRPAVPPQRPPIPIKRPPVPNKKPALPSQRPPPPAQRPPRHVQKPVSSIVQRPPIITVGKINKETAKPNDVAVSPSKIKGKKEASNPVVIGEAKPVTNLSKLKSASAPNLFGDLSGAPFSNGLIHDVILEEEDVADGNNNGKKKRFSNMAVMALGNFRGNRMKPSTKTGANKGVRKWQSFMNHRPTTNPMEDAYVEKQFIENEISSLSGRYSELHLDLDSSLFDYVVVVSLETNDNKSNPCIVFQFPPKLDKLTGNTLLDSIPQFCFPGDMASLSYNHGDTFSFVLTNDTGLRSYGFCRMIQTANMEQPEVYCIISPYGLFSLYTQILEEVQFQRQFSSTAVFSFLKTILSKPLPQPTESLDISFFSSGSKEGIRKITLTRPGDTAIHEHVHLYVFFERLAPALILELLSLLLIENKIVLCSKSLSLLSTSCHALISLMYPFDWEHTFIPVLPNKLIDVLCLPTPYLLGILPSILPELEDLPIEDVSILDLDSGEWIVKANVKNSLPKHLCEQVISSVKVATSVESDSDVKEKAQNEIISEIFVQMYLHIMGHFENYYTEVDGVSIINNKPFCKASHTKEHRSFLKVFTPTQAFQKFTMSRKCQGPLHGLFENRYAAYKEAKTMDRTGHFKKNIENLLSVFKKKHH